jgi:triphosphoribosyl-dephospho-CoA synthase
LPKLQASLGRGWSLNETIVRVHLEIMSEYPDSLIARKLGVAIARRSADQAAAVLAAGELGSDDYQRALADFDFWLRSDGHRRNPGTTADLIVAALFAGLRDGLIDRIE